MTFQELRLGVKRNPKNNILTRLLNLITMAMAMAIMKLVWVLTLMFTGLSGAQANKSVKLFIIAGDANVEGWGSVPELQNLAVPPGTVAHDNSTPPNAYEHLVDDDGKWVISDDVYVTYDHRLDGTLKRGPLTVKGFGHTPNTFGPDVEFGTIMGNSLRMSADKVVIVKAGWAHKTLAMDFRSPTAGVDHGDKTGAAFLRIVSSVHETIDGLRGMLGNDYANADVEICGLVWWQGYDDIILGVADQYESNLQHFIRDIRIALEVPSLPVLIAELGGRGTKDVTRMELDFRAMQQRVVNLPEFKDNTKYVETAKYCVEPTGDYTHYNGSAYTVVVVGRLMVFYMTRLAGLDRFDPGTELVEVDFEHSENDVHLKVMLFSGLAIFGVVVFVAFKRGGISRATLTKAWKDTVQVIKGSGKEKTEDDEEFSIEMREDRSEELPTVV
jgi:hypothetical protein